MEAANVARIQPIIFPVNTTNEGTRAAEHGDLISMMKLCCSTEDGIDGVKILQMNNLWLKLQYEYHLDQWQ